MTTPADWLQLLQAKGLPLRAKRALVRALGSPSAALRADADAIADALTLDKRARARLPSRLKFPDADAVDADLAALDKLGADFIGFDHADFPPLLNQIDSAPLGLFVRGDRELLARPQLAIVGSRAPTPSGRRTTEQFAAELSALGFAITSGMAAGIDQCAHRGCLDAGGDTVAVVATGIDVVYPRSHRALADEIAERGLLVSEYPPGTAPLRAHFPQRNRLISGLSLGTLVVEASIRSGSLITARCAGEQGREVFAVPGSIHTPLSRGCHKLLRQGAKLVETSADILDEIGQFFAAPAGAAPTAAPAARAAPPDADEARLYGMIDHAAIGADELIARSGLTADEVSYILTRLELGGWIAAADGGYQRLPQSPS